MILLEEVGVAVQRTMNSCWWRSIIITIIIIFSCQMSDQSTVLLTATLHEGNSRLHVSCRGSQPYGHVLVTLNGRKIPPGESCAAIAPR